MTNVQLSDPVFIFFSSNEIVTTAGALIGPSRQESFLRMSVSVLQASSSNTECSSNWMLGKPASGRRSAPKQIAGVVDAEIED